MSNIGDSSFTLLGLTNEFISVEYKWADKKEIKRIEKVGGSLIDDRLGGILAVSRGLGDFDLKTKRLSCEQHIVKNLIDPNLKYCVLTSDGVWDVLNPKEVIKLIENKKLEEMAKIIVETTKEKVLKIIYFVL